MPHNFEISERNNRIFARAPGGPEFLVGKSTKFTDDSGVRRGLMSAEDPSGPTYRREHFRSRFGVWADFVYPTGTVEGGRFDSLNTYDRARFTFGFLQFAAHVPEGDFVQYFRRLLSLPTASDYFPDLRLEGGRIAQVRSGSVRLLETDRSTGELMEYLNPTSAAVEPVEIQMAARLIHWVRNDRRVQELQVEVGIELFKSKMVSYDRDFGLDGTSDKICLVIADIRHQGRAKNAIIRSALRKPNPFEALLGLGGFPVRREELRVKIAELVAEGTLGKRTYSRSRREFVDVNGIGSSFLGDDELATTVHAVGEDQLWLYAGGRRRPLKRIEEVEELRTNGLLDMETIPLERSVLEAIPLMFAG
jgi:hypothetical protein